MSRYGLFGCSDTLPRSGRASGKTRIINDSSKQVNEDGRETDSTDNV